MENIHSYLHPIDFTIVGIYLLILIAIGYWVSARNKDKSENLFLAGRSLGWGSIGFTMWGTNVGPSMLIASASIGYTTGVVAGNFGWYAFVFIFLLAVVFAPRYLSANVQTLPEFMGKRFGQSTRNILAWYTIITILISWLALTLFAGGIVVGQILNFPLWLSVIILVVISSFFTMAGGLKAVAYTNVFQMLLLIVVSMVLTVVSVMKVGGPIALFEKTPAQ
jgi:SSS family solute:Na+ symporter